MSTPRFSADALDNRHLRIDYLVVQASKGMGHDIRLLQGGRCEKCGQTDLWNRLEPSGRSLRHLPRCPYGEV